MLNKKLILAAAAGLIAFSAQAATITITPVVKAFWATGADPFADAPTAPVISNGRYVSAGTYQVDVKVSTVLGGNDSGWTGLGQLSYSLNKTGNGLTYSPDLGYTPYLLKQNSTGTRVSYTDPLSGALVTNGAGATASTAVVTDGGDIGPSATDYKYLYFEAGGAQSAIGKTLTQSTQDAKVTALLGQPTSIGTFLVTFTASGAVADITSALNTGEGANLADGAGGFQNTAQSAGNTVQFSSVGFGDIPEPATLSLAALGGLAVIRRRRA